MRQNNDTEGKIINFREYLESNLSQARESIAYIKSDDFVDDLACDNVLNSLRLIAESFNDFFCPPRGRCRPVSLPERLPDYSDNEDDKDEDE